MSNGKQYFTFQAGFNLLSGLLILVGAYVLSGLIEDTDENGLAIARIQANRFTSADGAALKAEMAALREVIAAMPTEVPPGWFLDEINRRFNEAAGERDRMQTQLDKIENKLDGGQ